MGFPKKDYWSGLSFTSPGDLPDPGTESVSHALAAGFFTTKPSGKAQATSKNTFISVTQLCLTLCGSMDYRFQAFLSITNSWSLFKLMSIESVMPFNHLILCHHLLLSPSIFPSIRVFSNESVLHIRWPKYWNFSFSISPSSEYSGLISFRMDWLDLFAVQGSLKESSPTPQFKSNNSSALRFLYGPTLTSIHNYWKNHSFD